LRVFLHDSVAFLSFPFLCLVIALQQASASIRLNLLFKNTLKKYSTRPVSALPSLQPLAAALLSASCSKIDETSQPLQSTLPAPPTQQQHATAAMATTTATTATTTPAAGSGLDLVSKNRPDGSKHLNMVGWHRALGQAYVEAGANGVGGYAYVLDGNQSSTSQWQRSEPSTLRYANASQSASAELMAPQQSQQQSQPMRRHSFADLSAALPSSSASDAATAEASHAATAAASVCEISTATDAVPRHHAGGTHTSSFFPNVLIQSYRQSAPFRSGQTSHNEQHSLPLSASVRSSSSPPSLLSSPSLSSSHPSSVSAESVPDVLALEATAHGTAGADCGSSSNSSNSGNSSSRGRSSSVGEHGQHIALNCNGSGQPALPPHLAPLLHFQVTSAAALLSPATNPFLLGSPSQPHANAAAVPFPLAPHASSTQFQQQQLHLPQQQLQPLHNQQQRIQPPQPPLQQQQVDLPRPPPSQTSQQTDEHAFTDSVGAPTASRRLSRDDSSAAPPSDIFVSDLPSLLSGMAAVLEKLARSRFDHS
jgi:hypothetical protein